MHRINASNLCFKVAVLVTTGPQDIHQPLSTPLADAAAQLQNAGVEVFSVGIGPNAVLSELETVASRPEYAFKVETANLPILSSQLTDMMRQGKVSNTSALQEYYSWSDVVVFCKEDYLLKYL